MCGRAGTAASSLAISRGAGLGISCLADAARCGHDRPADQHSACGGLTWAAHSSVTVILLVMAFASQAVVPPHAAFALMFGANLGTALNALLESGLGGDPAAKRLPIGNLINRIVGCAPPGNKLHAARRRRGTVVMAQSARQGRRE
jgi:hypothetical protein